MKHMRVIKRREERKCKSQRDIRRNRTFQINLKMGNRRRSRRTLKKSNINLKLERTQDEKNIKNIFHSMINDPIL